METEGKLGRIKKTEFPQQLQAKHPAVSGLSVSLDKVNLAAARFPSNLSPREISFRIRKLLTNPH